MPSNFNEQLWAKHILDRRDAGRAWFNALPEHEQKAVADAMIDYLRCASEPEPDGVED